MEEEVIKIIYEEIDRLDKIIKEDSKLISNNRDVYNILKPKGKDFQTINVIKLSNDRELLNKMVDLVSSSNLVAVEEMIKKKLEFDDYDKEVNEKLISVGLTKDFIYSDAFINYVYIKSKQNKKLLKVYNELLEMKKREKELFRQNEEIVSYICNVAINVYEDTINEKERLKKDKKGLKYAIESIKKEEKLTIWSLSSLEKLYNYLDDASKKKLVIFIQRYNEKIEKEKIKKEIKELEKQKHVKEENIVTYSDETYSYEEVDPLSIKAKKYLDSLINLDKTMIFQMLDQLSLNSNFITIINYMISFLDEDDKLQTYLEEFLEKYFESNVEYKEETKDDNLVLYYGFSLNKNYILNDISNIPEEYYKDILKAIEKIKRCNFKNSAKNITDLRKAFEVRVNSIRITCKRIDENTYVILGIYCKKTKRDRLLISDTTKRLKLVDNTLSDFTGIKKINCIWEKYLELNNEIEIELKAKLKSKINNC